MAQPNDGAVHSKLSQISEMFKEEYSDVLLGPVHVMGGWAAKAFNPKAEVVVGDGKNFKIKYQKSSPTTTTKNALAEFGDADPIAVSEIKVRFNQADPTTNDFGRSSAAVQVTHWDMVNKDKGAILDLVEDLVKDAKQDIKLQRALWRNTGPSGVIALVNGTKKGNQSTSMSECTAYSSGATSFRANIDSGTAARFWPGQRVDIYTSSNALAADRLKVTDVNPADPTGPSVGFEIQSGATIADCDLVADNSKIAIYGSFNQGPITLEDWMAGPTSTSETWLGGISRLNKQYRQLIPLRMRVGSTTASISKTMLDDLLIARGYLMDDDDITVIRCNPQLEQTLRNQIEAAAFIQWPSDTEKRKRFAHLGTSGLTYQSPAGIVSFQTDPLAAPTFMDAYCAEDWAEAVYGTRNMQILPGDTAGNWSRMNSATPGGGKTLIYRMEMMQLFLDWCFRPQCQSRILNLQP